MSEAHQKLLMDMRQLVRDLRGVAFVGSHTVRAADPLLLRCDDIERRASNEIGDNLCAERDSAVVCDTCGRDIPIRENALYRPPFTYCNGICADKGSRLEELKSMLVEVVDANYGANIHDIGNGDGIQEPIATRLREFWQSHLEVIRGVTTAARGVRE